MEKNDKKGFMLTELLVTSTLICTVLVFLYSQFYTIKRSYENSFKYNTVNSLYASANIKEFLLDNGISTMEEILETNPYIDLKNDTSTIKDQAYFNILLSSLNVKTILITNADLTELIPNLNDIEGLSEEYKRFVRKIDFDESSTDYRLIIEYNDNTFTSILMGDGKVE